LKKYGVIFADQGSNMYISGTTNLNWADAISQIQSAHPINGSFFEAVQSPYPIVYGYSTAGFNITCNGRIQNTNPNWQPPANNETCPGVSTTTTSAAATSATSATSATLGTSTSATATTSFNSTDNTISTSSTTGTTSTSAATSTTTAATTTTTTTTTTASGLQYITAQAAFQKSTGISQGAVAGVVIGTLAFVGIAAVVVFLLIRRRNSMGYSSSTYRAPPSAQTEMKVTPATTTYTPSISEDNNEKSSFVSQQPSSFGYSKSGKRIPPPPPKGFEKGSTVQAKYTQDGQFYRARVDDIQGTQYLVSYVDFGGEQEWLPLESLKN